MNKWLSLAANVGVLIGIFFLAYELRQSNQLGRLEAMQTIGDAWLFTGWEIGGNKEMAALLAEVVEGAVRSDFDSGENYQIFSVLWAVDHSWQMRYNQLQLGILDPDDYSFPDRTNPFYNSDYHREIWPAIRADFKKEFADFWEKRFELSRGEK